MNRWEALALLAPFAIQVFLPLHIGSLDVRMSFTIGYIGLAIVLLVVDSRRREAIRKWPEYIRASVRGKPPAPIPGKEQAATTGISVRP